MTKFFSILALAGFTVSMNAQVMINESFNNFNLGTIVGQGSPGYDAMYGAMSDYQIVANGNNSSKGLAISSPLNDSRYLTSNIDLSLLWDTRTTGNNVLQLEYDFFTGPATTSKHNVGVEIESIPSTTLGFTMAQNTKTLKGIINYGDIINLNATPIVLPPNTWVRLGLAWNSTTNKVTYNGPGFNSTITSVSSTPIALHFNVSLPAGTNPAASVSTFDNILLKSVPTAAFLSTDEKNISEAGFSIFPNPSTDYLNIKINTKYAEVYIYDASGIRTNAKVENNQVDVRNLTQGVYVLGVKTEKGLLTQKFIKK
jgi:hypothetical protein